MYQNETEGRPEPKSRLLNRLLFINLLAPRARLQSTTSQMVSTQFELLDDPRNPDIWGLMVLFRSPMLNRS